MAGIRNFFVIVMLVSAFMLAGCLSSEGLSGEGIGSGGSALTPGAPSAPPSPTKDSGGSGSGAIQQSSQMIIKTGSAAIEVPSGTIESRYSQFKGLVSNFKGEITDSTYYESQNEKTYRLTVRLDPSKFDDFAAGLADIGTVTSLTSSGEDVTTQYIDITAKLENLNASRNRLLELYNRTEDIDSIIKIEQELTDLQYQIDSTTQQKLYLERQSSKATMTVTITEPAPAVDSTILNPLGQLANLFLGALVFGLMLIVGAAGFVIPVGIALFIVYLAVKAVFLNRLGKRTEKK